MFSKLIFSLLTIVATVSFAEVKRPGQVIPTQCGQNEIKTFAPGLYEVCMVNVVGKRGQYLTAYIEAGDQKGTYLYKHYQLSKNECQNGVAGLSCTRTFFFVGKVNEKGFMVLAPNLRIKRATVHTIFGSINHLSSEDLIGSAFESTNMGLIAVTQ